MDSFNKKAFSLIEVMISLIIISCVTAAFAPVISKKLSSSEVTINEPSQTSLQDEQVKISQAVSEAMNNCRISKDKTKLICEVELSSLKTETDEDNEPAAESLVKVKYSERRDKIRFDNRESGNYKTTNITRNKPQEVIIPLEKYEEADEELD